MCDDETALRALLPRPRKEVLNQNGANPSALVGGAHAQDSKLGILALKMAGHVASGCSIDLRDKNCLRKATKAVLNPNFIEEIAFGPIEVLVEIETGIAVGGAGDIPERRQVLLASGPNKNAGGNGRNVAESMIEGHTHVNEEEAVGFGESSG